VTPDIGDGDRPSRVLERMRDEVRAVAARHKVQRLSVFGSVARRTDRPDSDIDLLARFAPSASLFDLVELQQELESLLGVHVDVLSEAGLNESHSAINQEARVL